MVMELHVALPMIGGIIIISGSILLLYKGKATLDVAEKKVLVVDIPRLGSVKAASAALGLFIVGAILLIVPLWLADNWRKERTGLTNEIEKLKAQSHKTVTIQGPVKSDRFPVVIYAASKLTALENVGEFTLRVPVYNNMDDDYVIICTAAGNTFTTARAPRDKLLNAATLQMNEIAFPTNDTSGMPKNRSAYSPLESSHLDQQMPAGYEPFSN
jgi:hypothetical protein